MTTPGFSRSTDSSADPLADEATSSPLELASFRARAFSAECHLRYPAYRAPVPDDGFAAVTGATSSAAMAAEIETWRPPVSGLMPFRR